MPRSLSSVRNWTAEGSPAVRSATEYLSAQPPVTYERTATPFNDLRTPYGHCISPHALAIESPRICGQALRGQAESR